MMKPHRRFFGGSDCLRAWPIRRYCPRRFHLVLGDAKLTGHRSRNGSHRVHAFRLNQHDGPQILAGLLRLGEAIFSQVAAQGDGLGQQLNLSDSDAGVMTRSGNSPCPPPSFRR